jgi:NADH-quinone oxidoreductase subunit C
VLSVPVEQWVVTLADLRDRGHRLLDFLTGVDRVDELEVLARVADPDSGAAVLVTTRVAVPPGRVPSVTALFPAAAWHERETAEMFGIEFVGHPDPRPLLLRSATGRPPLLRSTVLASRAVTPWPGAPDSATGGRASRRRQQPPGVPDGWLQDGTS